MGAPGQAWRMHAHRYGDGRLCNAGPLRYVELHGLREPVVAVTVTITDDDDPAATHWGWLWADAAKNWHDGAPCMIQPHDGLFRMQFPYGVRAEEEAGRGRAVRLIITPEEQEN